MFRNGHMRPKYVTTSRLLSALLTAHQHARCIKHFSENCFICDLFSWVTEMFHSNHAVKRTMHDIHHLMLFQHLIDFGVICTCL